jgi:hypothetical protein
MTQPGWVRAYRAAFALLTLGTIVYLFRQREEVGDPTQAEPAPGDTSLPGDMEHAGTGDIVKFFSFFTIQSNLIAAAVFLVQAAHGARWPTPLAGDVARGASLLYLATTGIVYHLLLAQEASPEEGSVSWIDNVLHRIMPLAVVVDWLIQPPTTRLRYRHSLIWTVCPCCGSPTRSGAAKPKAGIPTRFSTRASWTAIAGSPPSVARSPEASCSVPDSSLRSGDRPGCAGGRRRRSIPT